MDATRAAELIHDSECVEVPELRRGDVWQVKCEVMPFDVDVSQKIGPQLIRGIVRTIEILQDNLKSVKLHVDAGTFD